MLPPADAPAAATNDAAEADPPLPALAVQRAIRYRMFAWLLILPSIGAGLILASDARRWLDPAGGGKGWPGLESWLALGLMLTHAMLGALAWRTRADHPASRAPDAAAPDGN